MVQYTMSLRNFNGVEAAEIFSPTGLPADAVRRSGAALAYGCWTVRPLLRAWQHRVHQEGRWHAHRYEGFCPVACGVVGFFRPRLQGCLTASITSLGLTKPCQPSSWRWSRRSGRSRVLRSYVASYHHRRTHRSLETNTPELRAVQLPELGPVRKRPAVGGLHHHDERRAA